MPPSQTNNQTNMQQGNRTMSSNNLNNNQSQRSNPNTNQSINPQQQQLNKPSGQQQSSQNRQPLPTSGNNNNNNSRPNLNNSNLNNSINNNKSINNSPLPNITNPQSAAVINNNRLNNNNSPINNISTNNSKPLLTGQLSPTPNIINNLNNTTTTTNNNNDIIKKPQPPSQSLVSQLVRKELEKSLAQIEFPKPPVQDIYFLPNTNNSEFLMCLGLEEVVKCVQEHLANKQLKQEQKQEAKPVATPNTTTESETTPATPATTTTTTNNVIEIKYDYPFYCAQCQIDFTPVWRSDKTGTNVLCEKCLKLLEKKQIKTEHNARLKQAFLKAVKDKEIIEKQLLAEQQHEIKR